MPDYSKTNHGNLPTNPSGQLPIIFILHSRRPRRLRPKPRVPRHVQQGLPHHHDANGLPPVASQGGRAWHVKISNMPPTSGTALKREPPFQPPKYIGQGPPADGVCPAGSGMRSALADPGSADDPSLPAAMSIEIVPAARTPSRPARPAAPFPPGARLWHAVTRRRACET